MYKNMNCQERSNRMEIILLLVLLLALGLALGLAALRWGANSTDSLNSPEWKRREERGGIF